MGQRGMGQLRLLLTIAALVAAISLVAVGCGGSGPDSGSELTGSDNEETTLSEGEDVIVKAIDTMFTWSPARDASPLDGYKRALPLLGGELREYNIELGNSVRMQEWKDAKLEVTAHALLVPSEHPQDTPDTVERAVMLTLTVTKPDGELITSITMRVERVVAKRGPEGWRVEDVSFFPQNEFRSQTQTQICPPGQSYQPSPDDQCVQNPPPQAKQCPDGSAVAPDQVCPPPQAGPHTKQCPDGTTVPATGPCPRRRRPKDAPVGRRRPSTDPAHPRIVRWCCRSIGRLKENCSATTHSGRRTVI